MDTDLIQIVNVWPGMMFELSRLYFIWPVLAAILLETVLLLWLTKAQLSRVFGLSIAMNVASTLICLVLLAFIDVFWFLAVSFSFSVLESFGIDPGSIWQAAFVGALIIDFFIATAIDSYMVYRFLHSHYAYTLRLTAPPEAVRWWTIAAGNALTILLALPAFYQFKQLF